MLLMNSSNFLHLAAVMGREGWGRYGAVRSLLGTLHTSFLNLNVKNLILWLTPFAGLAIAYFLAPVWLHAATGQSDGPTYDVIVVGAGFAGVAAGSRLFDMGINNFIILEAKGAIGGRVSERVISGTKVGLGAGWVHGINVEDEPNAIWQLAEQVGLRVHYDDYKNLIFRDGESGKVQTEEFKASWERLLSVQRYEVARLVAEQGDLSLQNALTAVGWQAASRIEEAVEYFRFDFENGLHPKDSSALHTSSTGDHQDVVVTDSRGFSYLLQFISRNFRDKILLNKDVQRLKRSGDSYVISTRDKSIYKSKYVMLAVSSAVLLADVIEIWPPLPAWKKEALKKSPTGHYCKIFLSFPRQFWDDFNYIIFGNSQQRGRYVHWQNLNRAGLAPGANILLLTLTGDECLKSQMLADDDIVADVMLHLRKVYGSDIPRPIDMVRSNWSFDPHVLGAYSNPGVGVTEDDYELLNEPVDYNRLWFTGEYASGADDCGDVNGAYTNGLEQGQLLAEAIHSRGVSPGR